MYNSWSDHLDFGFGECDFMDSFFFLHNLKYDVGVGARFPFENINQLKDILCLLNFNNLTSL